MGTLRYTPYGVVRYEWGHTPTDRLFTGQRWEGALALYDYRARFYDPALGRFLQPDPLVPEPGNPQALNRYAYVYNNPLRYTDPSGHIVETLWDIVAIGLDLYTIRQEGLTWGNALALAVDVGTVLLPGVPAFAGVIAKAGKAASRTDDVLKLARAVSWAERFAGASPEIRRGVEYLEKMVKSERIPERFRRGFAAELLRPEEYFKAGKLQAVEAVIESGRVDLILVTGEVVEVKYWRQSYAKGHIEQIIRQLRQYQASDRQLKLEFVRTSTDPITDEFLKTLRQELQRAGIDLSRLTIEVVD